jgi:hypothetical protein
MRPEVIAAIVLAIPVILFPVAFVWYLTLGGLKEAAQEARKKAEAKAETEKVTAR